MKGSDASCVSLTPDEHDMLDGRQKLPNGETGKAAFEAYFGIDLKAEAERLFAIWSAMKR